jgi:hypothetical protein
MDNSPASNTITYNQVLTKKLTEMLIIIKGKSTQTTREKSKVESIIASASIFAKSI